MNHFVIEDTVTASERNLRGLGNAVTVEHYDTLLVAEKVKVVYFWDSRNSASSTMIQFLLSKYTQL